MTARARVAAPLALTASLFALTSCATRAATSPDEDREQLIARVDQFHDAIREGDKEKYGDVFVEDFVFTWSRNGQIYDRATILPNVVPTPDFAPLVDEALVRIFGDSATVTFRVRQKPEDAGARVTFSCARIDGVWKVVASQGTPIVIADESADE